MTQRIYLLLPVLWVLTLSACQPVGQTTTVRPDTSAEIRAVEAEQSGDYIAAGEQYLALAESTREPQQSSYYLRAAEAFWQINYLEQTSAALAKIDASKLNQTQQLDVAILEAEIALTQSQAEQALATLSSFDLEFAEPTQQQKALKLRIQAYEATGNWLEKANSHIALAIHLNDAQTIFNNQQALWQSLMTLTPEALDLFNPGVAPAIDSGWFALAYITKTYASHPETLVVALEDWQRNYPNHPADPLLYEEAITMASAQTQLPEQFTDIAILLPDTGPYAAAANAIKQGFLAAHFSDQSSTRLHFYAVQTDLQTGYTNVWQRYQQAVAQNADLVIGPLDKESVQVLAEAESLPIPVLSLNRLNTPMRKDNLFQFGLAPEDDAVAAANYASQRGFQRALILAPVGSWGDRITSAFRDQWLSNGGILLDSAQYDESQNDFSTTITPLLGLQSSKQRAQLLKQSLGVSLEFEPRRRQDIDFIFLVAKPLKARQLLPQLKFHRTGQLPVIATSHAYSGQENSQQDIDLNGLIINDIPWMFLDLARTDPTYQVLQNNPPPDFNHLLRLYALGADAYTLTNELNGMTRSSSQQVQGATGMLSINEIGQIVRSPNWATFEQGIITLLPPIADTRFQ